MSRYPKKKKVFFAFLLFSFIYFIVTAISISNYAGKDQTQQADVAIVLGTAIWGDEPSPVFRERIHQGIRLYKSGYIKKIIFTGGKVNGNALSESYVAKKYAEKHGVDSTDILIEERSRITLENLKFAKVLMAENHLATALVVSDPLHMKRGMSMAKDMHISAYPSPTSSSRFKSRKAKFGFLMGETVFYTVYRIYRVFQ
ncbi:MAG: YdcF family protein [Leadbetterella sp.]|nr:YdcF family protein [Leadbetterella sp.]